MSDKPNVNAYIKEQVNQGLRQMKEAEQDYRKARVSAKKKRRHIKRQAETVKRHWDELEQQFQEKLNQQYPDFAKQDGTISVTLDGDMLVLEERLKELEAQELPVKERLERMNELFSTYADTNKESS